MNEEKPTKSQIVVALSACYERGKSNEAFFELLKLNGIETYELNGKIDGMVVDGTMVNFDYAYYLHQAIQNIYPIEYSEQILPLVESYQAQMKSEELHLDSTDIIPSKEKLAEEMGTKAMKGRKDELNEIREGKEEVKEIDKEFER